MYLYNVYFTYATDNIQSYLSIHIEIGIYLHIHLLNIINYGCATTFIAEKSIIINPKILKLLLNVKYCDRLLVFLI